VLRGEGRFREKGRAKGVLCTEAPQKKGVLGLGVVVKLGAFWQPPFLALPPFLSQMKIASSNRLLSPAFAGLPFSPR